MNWLNITELMIHLQETLKEYGDMEVRASIYDVDYDEHIEDEITNIEVERYIATERYGSNHALVLNNGEA